MRGRGPRGPSVGADAERPRRAARGVGRQDDRPLVSDTRPPEIVLVRHGETEWTLSGQHTGSTDIPLTERGRADRKTVDIRKERPGWSLWRDGVPNGESAADVAARVDRVIRDLRAVDGDAVVFAHGHLLRVLAARWLGLEPEAGRLFALDPATISVLGYERETSVLRLWNERRAVQSGSSG